MRGGLKNDPIRRGVWIFSGITHYENYFRCNKLNIKNIWKVIRQIVALKPMAYVTPSKVVVNSSNKVLYDTNDIANEFNDYFANIGKTLSQAIPRVN